jgi:hypothetical protein
MLQHFENVLGSNPPELCAEVINLLNDHDFDDINIDILDFEISEDEIIKAIKKLKYGTSAQSSGGFDPKTFSKCCSIVLLSIKHFDLDFGLTDDQNFLGSVLAILQSSSPFLFL